MSLRWTEQEYAAHVGKCAQKRSPASPLPPKPEAKKRRGVMNRLEADFAGVLENQKRLELIVDFKFEPITLRLARGAKYTPDFAVWNYDGSLDFFETKGFWREAGRLRIKLAAEIYKQHNFIAVQKNRKKDGGGWEYEHF